MCVFNIMKVLYMEDPSFIPLKYLEVTPVYNSVKNLPETGGHQYLTTISTIRERKANYDILPLEKSSSVNLLIISQSVSCCC